MKRKIIEIQHPSHEHPLILHDIKDNSQVIHCHICNDDIKDFPYFVCYECNRCLHYLCVLPFLQQINNPIHHNHPLILQPIEYYRHCNICNYSIGRNSLSYSCVGCQIHIDIYCALNIPTVLCETKSPHDNHQHLCHKQPLDLVDSKDGKDDDVNCYICELPLPSQLSYSCKICNNFFHKSCVELSPEITHCVHPMHSLIVSPVIVSPITVGTVCFLCGKKCFNFIFKCNQCRLNICVGCRDLKPIMCQVHSHPLFLKLSFIPNWEKTCETPFTCYDKLLDSYELRHAQSYVFVCGICNFYLHFFCGPLPCVIKHDCHIHPLTLFDSMVEDDSGEYYCDACEMERDPRLCVYYCAECKYIAHVHCVISEVLRILDGDHSNVNLRFVGHRKMVIDMEEHKILRSENEKIVNEELPEKQAEAAGNQTLMTFSDLIISVTKQFGLNENDSQGVAKAEKEKEQEAEEKYQDEEEDSLEEEEENKEVLRLMSTLEKNHWKVIKDKDPLPLVRSLLLNKKEYGEGREYHVKSGDGLRKGNYSKESIYRFFILKLNYFNYEYRKWRSVKSNEKELKIVNVGGYMIPWHLSSVMEDLLDKHGDISGKKISSPELKSLIFFFLCRVLLEMSIVMVVDVTEDLLGNWYSCLHFAKSNGFEVGFVMSHLKRVARAYFGFEINKFQNEVKRKTEGRILKIQNQIAKLEDELKNCKEYLEEHERNEGSKRSKLMDKCLNEGVELKWKKVAHGLL